MSAIRARHEPEPREDPRNALLDIVEHAIRAALDHGCGPQLRTLIERLLPPAAPEPQRPVHTIRDDPPTPEIRCATEADARRAYDAEVRRRVETALAGLPRERRIALEEAFARTLPGVQAALFRTKRKFGAAYCWPEARAFLLPLLDLGLPAEAEFIAGALGDRS